MARVLLINPPWYVFLGHSSSAISTGLISLAGYLRKIGHDVAVYNPDMAGHLYSSDLDVLRANETYRRRMQDESDPIFQEVRARISLFRPDVVGVHAKTPSWISACRVARIAKELLPGSMTVCGGPHISCMPTDLVPASGFDYGVVGEGEIAFGQLIGSKVEDRAAIAGLVSASSSLPGKCLPASYVQDLDGLPFDGRELIWDIGQYDKMGLGAVSTARGCPYPCEYCASHKIWTRKVRYRSAANVMQEIDYLKERFGLKYFEFCDDTFTVNTRRAIEICEALCQRDGVRWKCTTRADCLNVELVKRMKKAGCVEVSIGVESGSVRILELIKKKETREEIAAGCKLLKQHGIPIAAFVMIGFPTETEAEAWETIRFATTLGVDSLVGSIVTPYPGTPFYDWALQHGRMPAENDWSGFYHQNQQMGLWDVPPAQARQIICKWFEAIERYNQRGSRLIGRFVSKFRSDPLGAVRKATSFLARKLHKP